MKKIMPEVNLYKNDKSITDMVIIQKKYFINLFLFLLCACSSSPNTNEQTEDGASLNSSLSYDTLRVICTEDQHHLTVQWMKDFQKDHQGIHAEVILYTDNIPPGKLSTEKNGLFLVMEPPAKQIPKNCWRIKYARDGIVGIVNEGNPAFEKIMESGLGFQSFSRVQTSKNSMRWSMLSGSEQTGPIKVFMCSDSLSTCKLLADYLMIDPDEFRIITTGGVLDLIDSVRLDQSSIGLCCQRYAYDLLTRMEIPEIKIIPLDCNANGVLEKKEMFYNNLDELRRAMWSGKYPCHSFLNYYIAVAEEPTNRLHIDFMKWVMTEGQMQLESEGYVLLRTSIINREIKRLMELSAST